MKLSNIIIIPVLFFAFAMDAQKVSDLVPPRPDACPGAVIKVDQNNLPKWVYPDSVYCLDGNTVTNYIDCFTEATILSEVTAGCVDTDTYATDSIASDSGTDIFGQPYDVAANLLVLPDGTVICIPEKGSDGGLGSTPILSGTDTIGYSLINTNSDGSIDTVDISIPVSKTACIDSTWEDAIVVFRNDTLQRDIYHRNIDCVIDTFSIYECKDTIHGGYTNLRLTPEQYLCDEFYLQDWNYTFNGRLFETIGGTFRKVDPAKNPALNIAENGGTVILLNDGTYVQRQVDENSYNVLWWEMGETYWDGTVNAIVSESDRIQSAIEVAQLDQGGGEIIIPLTVEEYELLPVGVYDATGTFSQGYAVEVKDNTVITLRDGVRLFLADGSYNTATDMFVGLDVDYVTIQGQGILDNNSDNNTGTYSQTVGGSVIWFFPAIGDISNKLNSEITIKDIEVKNSFANSINIGNSDGVLVQNVNSRGSGEGIQVTYSEDIEITDCFVSDFEARNIADAFELSNCVNATMVGNKAIANLSAISGGAAFDVYGSSNVSIGDFVADGWHVGIQAQIDPASGNIADDIFISNGTLNNCKGVGIKTAEGYMHVSDVFIDSPGLYGITARETQSGNEIPQRENVFSNVHIRNAAFSGIDISVSQHLIFQDCIVEGSAQYGIAIGQVTGANVDVFIEWDDGKLVGNAFRQFWVNPAAGFVSKVDGYVKDAYIRQLDGNLNDPVFGGDISDIYFDDCNFLQKISGTNVVDIWAQDELRRTGGNLTQLNNMAEEQELRIFFDAPGNVLDQSANGVATWNIQLSGDANGAFQAGDILDLRYDNTTGFWWETNRSIN